MYLAYHRVQGKNRYVIRESRPDGPWLTSRDLFDLGPDPARFIVYPGGRAYYIDEQVDDRLRALGVAYADEELDDLFFPFVDPEIRYKLEWIARRRCRRKKTGVKPAPSRKTPYHLFDKRRIHFLRSGRMDQGYIGRMPQKMLKVLDEKSRDEIEQYFMKMETVLEPRELKSYVFVIFDLQRFFTESFAKTTPQMLTQDQVDAVFVEEVCRLDLDPTYWAGMSRGERLNAYLARYVVMYFDHDYGQGRFLDDVIRNFINNRRRYHPPESVRVKMTEAADIFNVTTDTLKKMKRADLARLYRRRAQKLHPDKGGNHDRFVKLTEAYHALLRRKA